MSNSIERLRFPANRWVGGLMLIWTLLAMVSMVWNLDEVDEKAQEEARIHLKALFNQDIVYRSWNAGHGGVYVPVSDKAQPNPYLSHTPDRDVTTTDGKQLTLMNPAYMTRQVHEILKKKKGRRGHITSLNPINPLNAPDAWETAMLKRFEAGEVSVFSKQPMDDGKEYYRYMERMLVEKPCLKCHEVQGYKLGDVRGGISVSIPVEEATLMFEDNSSKIISGHLALWLFGIAGLLIGGRRQIRAEERILLEKHFSDSLVKTAQTVVLVLNPDATIRYINPYMETLSSFKLSEVEGKDWFDTFLPERDWNEIRAVFSSAITEQQTHGNVNPIISKDGHEIFIEWYDKTLKDQNGRVIGLLSTGQDVTQRIQSEKELRSSRVLLDGIVENIPAMIFLKRASDLRFELFNKAGEELLGYDRNDLIGKNDYDFFDKEQADFFVAKDREVLASHKVLVIDEESITTASGETRTLNTFKVGLYDENGAPTYLLGISLDITDRKHTQKQLQRSEARFTALFKGNRCAQLLIDPVDGKIIEANLAAEQFYGYSLEQLKGMKISDINTLSKEDVRAEMELAKAERRSHFIFKHRLASGEVRDVEVHSGPISWESKPLLYSIIHDISDKKRAEDKLQKSEQHLRQAQVTAHLGSWTYDMNGRITWSDELYHIYGVSPDTFIPSVETINELIHPDDRAGRQAWIDACITGKEIAPFEFRIIRPDGDIRYLRSQGELIRDAEGHPDHMSATSQDITEHKRLEDQFYQAQKMEALGTLVGGIAHDFNNILAGITGNLYLARKHVKELPEAVDKLDTVEKLSFRASDLIKQLLAYARKDMVVMKPLPLIPYLKETLKLLRSSLPENIHLQEPICSDSLVVNGDGTQLHQVLMNLVNNSRDALAEKENPTVTVGLEMFETDDPFISHHPYFKRAAYAHLSVKDNGCGIPESHLAHLFEPFYTTKEVGKGTGLGLAMVFGAIKTHHGYVEVESIEGKGSTFHIYLPLIDDGSEQVLSKKSGMVEGAGETILLADDDANVLKTTSEVLKLLGYHVLVAENGEQALELFRENAESIDLVISDLVMPVMGGHKAVQAMRQIKPDMKAIYVTGYDSNGDAHLNNELVIRKPFVVEELSRLISQQLEK